MTRIRAAAKGDIARRPDSSLLPAGPICVSQELDFAQNLAKRPLRLEGRERLMQASDQDCNFPRV
jgi:hypothetical protein